LSEYVGKGDQWLSFMAISLASSLPEIIFAKEAKTMTRFAVEIT
jgi:hypothetical protein